MPSFDVLRLWSRHRIQPRVGRRPFVDLSFAMTWAGGGDEIASARLSNGSTEVIDAGTGFLMSVNAMVTPVWLRDVVGFGAGGALGFKVWDITATNGQITLKRYPAMATLHTALRLDDDWFVFLAAAWRKIGVELSGRDIAAGIGGSALSNVGAVGRLMFYGRLSDSAALDAGADRQPRDVPRRCRRHRRQQRGFHAGAHARALSMYGSSSGLLNE